MGTTWVKREHQLGEKYMEDQNFKDQCADLMQELNIRIPCRLAERIEAYASENSTTLTNVVIEALDAFLRK